MREKKEDIVCVSEAERSHSLTREACPCCGRQIGFDHVSLGELATNILCCILLMAIAIPLFCITEHWLEHQGQRSFDHLIWRERIDDL